MFGYQHDVFNYPHAMLRYRAAAAWRDTYTRNHGYAAIAPGHGAADSASAINVVTPPTRTGPSAVPCMPLQQPPLQDFSLLAVPSIPHEMSMLSIICHDPVHDCGARPWTSRPQAVIIATAMLAASWQNCVSLIIIFVTYHVSQNKYLLTYLLSYLHVHIFFPIHTRDPNCN